MTSLQWNCHEHAMRQMTDKKNDGSPSSKKWETLKKGQWLKVNAFVEVNNLLSGLWKPRTPGMHLLSFLCKKEKSLHREKEMIYLEWKQRSSLWMHKYIYLYIFAEYMSLYLHHLMLFLRPMEGYFFLLRSDFKWSTFVHL